ncbi:MAG: hypothetical protein LBV41_08840 [Cytophagaceae bacterium]|jgi:mRNA interferase RelE/StbE|nr:hypothetical protein [Cytophagaceae bacterium]
MKTDFKASFLRHIKKIRNEHLLAKISEAILNVENAVCLQDIPELKKMKGDRKGIFYRIKVDDYRIGITIEGKLATFVVCMPRKDIYKFFP